MSKGGSSFPNGNANGGVGVVWIALLVALAAACGAAPSEPQAPVPKEDRLRVLRCYADGYEFRYRTKVDLTKSDVEAAETLYAKEGGSAKRACDLIQRAFAREECKGVTLRALANDPDYCTITEAQLGSKPNINPARLQEWKQRPMIETPDGRRRDF